MKRGLLTIILYACISVLLFSFMVSAADYPLYHKYDSLVIEGSVNNPILIEPTGSKARIESVEASILWYPHKAEITTEPSSTKKDDALLFTLNNPDFGDHVFITKFKTTNKVNQPIIAPTPFPLAPLSASYARYTMPGEIINTNDDIKALAASLSAGDDEFKVVSTLAKWVKENIKYDLSTQAVEASQSSTWVLENRRGVCDELTNLFISLSRSLGIPARFVSGLSYTTSDAFSERWGPHGWAEVYFPGTGWVPYDVTYGQLGWVDSTHIVFGKSAISGDHANSFTWRGYNAEVKPQSMSYDVQVESTGNKLSSPLEITATVAEKEVGKNSYDVVVAKVVNTGNGMLAEDVTLAQTQGLQILSKESQVISLAPKETGYLFWIVRVTESITSGYEYRFPVIVYSSRGINDSAELTGRINYQSYSKSWADQYVERFSLTDEEQTGNALLCEVASPYVRVGETFDIVCESETEVCVKESCWPSQGGKVTISMSFQEAALHAIVLTRGEDKTFVQVTATQEPQVVISNVVAPQEIAYDEKGTISFTVEQEQGLPINVLDVELIGQATHNSWSFTSAEPRNFNVDISGTAIVRNPTEYVIVVSYIDDQDMSQKVTESILIRQGKAAWWQKFLWWLSNLTT